MPLCFMKPSFLQAVLHYPISCTAMAHSPANLFQHMTRGPPDAQLSEKQLQLSSSPQHLLSPAPLPCHPWFPRQSRVSSCYPGRSSTSHSVELCACKLVGEYIHGEYIHGQQHRLNVTSRRQFLPAFPSAAASITSLLSTCFSISMKFKGLQFFKDL